MKPSALLLSLALLALVALRLTAADWYVHPDGDDANAGDAANPFRTISAAAAQAQPGDTVWIAPGTYRETVRPARSGEPGNPIVFRSLEPSDPAVINGADVVMGPWERQGQSNVYAADWVGDYTSINMQADQVFMDGLMIDLLRWPKNVSEREVLPTVALIDEILAYTPNQLHGPMTIAEADFDEPDGRWDNARVWVNLSPPGKGDGQGQTGRIITTSEADGTIVWRDIDDRSKREFGRDSNWFVLAGSHYYLFDPTPEGLVATGGAETAMAANEWWLNRETRRLYVSFPEGTDPSDHTVEARRRDWGFDLADLSHIVVRDLALFATSITTDPDPVGDKPTVTASTGITLDRLHVRYVTHFTNQDNDLDYQGSWMGQSGIILSGRDHVVRNCTFDGSAGSAISVTGRDHRVYNNLIENFNYMVTEAAGINTSKDRADTFSVDHKIGYNTLRASPGSAIFFKPAWNSDPHRPGRYRIHHNLVYDILHRLWDAGAMTTVGDILDGVRIDHNVIHGGHDYIQFGIYVDYGGGAYIHHNVVYDTWSPIGGNGYELIQLNNNVAIETPVGFPFQPNGIHSGKGVGDLGGVALYNNIITGGFSTFQDATVVANINDSRRDLEDLFVNADGDDFRQYDYQLAASATAAIDEGVVVPGFDDPWLGSAPDIGAYEHGREPWQPGYGAVPWYLDDHDTLRFAAQGTTIEGYAVLHPFAEDASVTELVVVETSPGVAVELGADSVMPDGRLDLSYTVDASVPAPSTGWFIVEGQQGAATHQQAFTFRILPAQTLAEIAFVRSWEEPVTFLPGQEVNFTAQYFDEEGFLMAVTPDSQWSASGGGVVDQHGNLQIDWAQGGPHTVSVEADGIVASVVFDVRLDWALDQPTTASSQLNANVPPRQAVDGNILSAWVSAAADGESLVIDLGEQVTVETVMLLWHLSLYGRRYLVETSTDGESWQIAGEFTRSEGGAVTHVGLDATGRYLRIRGLERSVTSSGFAIYEVSVYGASAVDFLGTPLSDPPGWRESPSLGTYYDATPSQDESWIYLEEHGWQFLWGNGLFLRGKELLGFDLARGEWWWHNAEFGRLRAFFSTGWEEL